MSNYLSLKSTINANIKQNGNEEITGPILNSVLNAMVDSLAGFHYSGIATPATDPGTPDSNVFYLASEAGTYTNFGGLAVAEGEVAILKYNGTWTKEVTGAATAAEVSQLAQKVNGLPEVAFQKSDYTLQPGLITGGVFRSNSVYGTKNKHVLIPMTANRGRTIRFATVAGHYSNSIAFLTTDTLVSGESAPYCSGTSEMSTSGDYTVPEDCVCLYVYAEREGADSFPSLKMLAIDGTVCSSDRADNIEANLATANQNIEAVGKHITLLNVNEVVGNPSGTYTLAEAIAAIPQSMRRGYCVLRYNTLIQSYYFQKIAFYFSSSLSSWNNLNYWVEIDIKDWSNVSESAGAFKMDYSGQTSVGTNTSIRRVLVPFDKMVVYRHSSDNFGRWRILVRYADNTNEFVDVTANEITTITPIKETLGFEFYLMSTSETCFIDADVLIGAAEKVFELTYKIDPTAESLGAVPINQGIGNAGRPLVVGADGKVAPGTATPSTVDGDAVRKVLSKELHLGADLASVTTMGTGWSGSVANGFTHASGNTDPLVLNPTTNGNAYLVTINCDTNAGDLYLVSIGDGPLLDPYNGTTQQRVGIISDGGAVKITPSSSFAGTMTIKVQECVAEEDASETVILDVYNVEAENMGAAITAFWNVAIGPGQSTLSKAVSASRNIAIGINSLPNLETGTRNIGIGTFALAQLKNGTGNIAIGADSIFLRQGGNDNISIGRAAMGGGTAALDDNVCIGRSAGGNMAGGTNIAIGPVAGYKLAGGSIAIGLSAGFSALGLNNIFIGRQAGYMSGDRAGNWNICIGPSTSYSPNVSKSLAIGFQATAEKSSQNVIGSTDSVETKVFGDLVVHGTDGINRRIVFNNDHSVTWEAVE